MFDIGFWELMLIGLIALLVVGPERLPKLAYTAGKWLGKGRSMLNAVKMEIDKEIKAEELKQVLAEQKKNLNPFEEIIEETKGDLQSLNRDTRQALGAARKGYESSDPSNPTSGAGGQDLTTGSDDQKQQS